MTKNNHFFKFIFILLANCHLAFGQTDNPVPANEIKRSDLTDSVKPQHQEVEVNFLFTYYEQDGNHAAVTGGIGTEELKDRAAKIIVNIPLDSISKLAINTGFSHYSSASTDRIDFKVSSASSTDFHGYFNLDYSKNNPANTQIWGVSAGGSVESDYMSTNLGGQWGFRSEEGNRELNFSTNALFDVIIPYLPVELRRTPDAVPTLDKRQTYQFSTTFSQVINKRLQVSVTGELVYQRGLLATTFHRVYFLDADKVKNETLPHSRIKFPIGLRVNYFIADFLITRLFYRFYLDDFGVRAHTAHMELPFKLGTFFTIYPFYRFHTQTGARYFQPFKQHNLNEKFYTSDYDLSALNSHYLGLGLHYAPLFGLGRFRLPWTEKITLFRSLDVRYGNYWRTDGLQAFMISLEVGFMVR